MGVASARQNAAPSDKSQQYQAVSVFLRNSLVRMVVASYDYNLKVGGSNPPPATKVSQIYQIGKRTLRPLEAADPGALSALWKQEGAKFRAAPRRRGYDASESCPRGDGVVYPRCVHFAPQHAFVRFDLVPPCFECSASRCGPEAALRAGNSVGWKCGARITRVYDLLSLEGQVLSGSRSRGVSSDTNSATRRPLAAREPVARLGRPIAPRSPARRRPWRRRSTPCRHHRRWDRPVFRSPRYHGPIR